MSQVTLVAKCYRWRDSGFVLWCFPKTSAGHVHVFGQPSKDGRSKYCYVHERNVPPELRNLPCPFEFSISDSFVRI